MEKKHSNIDYQKQEANKHKEAILRKDSVSNLQQSVEIFHDKISKGCIYVCSTCQQTQFEDNVVPVNNLWTAHMDLLKECLLGYKSVNQIEYICQPCKMAIYKGCVPKLSLKNESGFPEQPIELQLYHLEEVIIAPVIPFMTIRELLMDGQKSLKGNMCHIPVDISPTINTLPHTLEDTQTVSVKLK